MPTALENQQIKMANGDGLFANDSAAASTGGGGNPINDLFNPNIVELEGRNFENAFLDSADNETSQFWNVTDPAFQSHPPITAKNKSYLLAAGQSKVFRSTIQLSKTAKEIVEGNLKTRIMKEVFEEAVGTSTATNYQQVKVAYSPTDQRYAILYRTSAGLLYLRQASVAADGAITLYAPSNVGSTANTSSNYWDIDIIFLPTRNKFVFAYSIGGTFEGQIRNAAINGDTFTLGSALAVYSGQDTGRFRLTAHENGTDVALSFTRGATYAQVKGFRCNTNTTMTAGALWAGPTGIQKVVCVKSGAANFIMCFYNNTTQTHAQRLNFAAYNSISASGGVGVNSNCLTYDFDAIWNPTLNKFMLFGRGDSVTVDGDNISGELAVSLCADGTAPAPSAPKRVGAINEFNYATSGFNGLSAVYRSSDDKTVLGFKDSSTHKNHVFTLDIAASGDVTVDSNEEINTVAAGTDGSIDIAEGATDKFLLLFSGKNPSNDAWTTYARGLEWVSSKIEQVGASFTQAFTVNGTTVSTPNDLENLQINNNKVDFVWTVTNTHGSKSLEAALGCIGGTYGGEKTYENSEATLLF